MTSNLVKLVLPRVAWFTQDDKRFDAFDSFPFRGRAKLEPMEASFGRVSWKDGNEDNQDRLLCSTVNFVSTTLRVET